MTSCGMDGPVVAGARLVDREVEVRPAISDRRSLSRQPGSGRDRIGRRVSLETLGLSRGNSTASTECPSFEEFRLPRSSHCERPDRSTAADPIGGWWSLCGRCRGAMGQRSWRHADPTRQYDVSQRRLQPPLSPFSALETADVELIAALQRAPPPQRQNPTEQRVASTPTSAGFLRRCRDGLSGQHGAVDVP